MGWAPPPPPPWPKDPILRKKAMDVYRRELEVCCHYNGGMHPVFHRYQGKPGARSVWMANVWVAVVSATGATVGKMMKTIKWLWRTLKWLWWKTYYLVRSVPNNSSMEDLLTMVGRTWAPWHKFKPYVYQDDRRTVEAVWSGEPTWTKSATVVMDVMVSQETGEIVGLRIPNRILEGLKSSDI